MQWSAHVSKLAPFCEVKSFITYKWKYIGKGSLLNSSTNCPPSPTSIFIHQAEIVAFGSFSSQSVNMLHHHPQL